MDSTACGEVHCCRPLVCRGSELYKQMGRRFRASAADRSTCDKVWTILHPLDSLLSLSSVADCHVVSEASLYCSPKHCLALAATICCLSQALHTIECENTCSLSVTTHALLLLKLTFTKVLNITNLNRFQFAASCEHAPFSFPDLNRV